MRRTILKRYLKEKSGNFAMMLALMMVPIMISVGIAIDYSRLVNTKSQLQDAADAAVLHAAVVYRQNDNTKFGLAKLEGEEAFNDNIELIDDVSVRRVKIKKTDDNSLTISSKARLKPMFMTLLGYPRLDVEVTAEANLGNSVGAEIVFAVDATNSINMSGNWDTMLDTVETILDDLEEYTGSDNLYVSLVPFQDRINIGTSRTAWLDGPAPAGWNGCVEPREFSQGGFNHMLDDDPANTDAFTPNFSGVVDWSPECTPWEITGPTNTPSDLITVAKSMSNNGTGRFDSAMAWSWRLLSTRWRGDWGIPDYPANKITDRRKYVVFVTDGRTTIFEREHSKTEDLGHNNGSVDGFEHLVEICDKMKNDDIEIFMMRLSGNDHAEPYFQDCASSAANYFNVTDVTDISLAFGDILDAFKADIRIVN